MQFGGALAATLVPEIGAGGSVLLRIGMAAVILLAARPTAAARALAKAWVTVVAFGVALGLMNWSFYGSLAHLPLGVAVTVEFLGPLVLTTVLSRRPLDFLAVLAAGAGVVLISEALTVPFDELSWVGLLLAATAGAFWAAYILLSGRTGAEFDKLDGLAIALVVSTVVVLPAGLTSSDVWTTGARGQGARAGGAVLAAALLPRAARRCAAWRPTCSASCSRSSRPSRRWPGWSCSASACTRCRWWAGARGAGQHHRDGGRPAADPGAGNPVRSSRPAVVGDRGRAAGLDRSVDRASIEGTRPVAARCGLCHAQRTAPWPEETR